MIKFNVDLKAIAKDMDENPDSPENLAAQASAKALAQHRDNEVAAHIVVDQIDSQFQQSLYGDAVILSWAQWVALRKMLRPGAEIIKETKIWSPS